MTFVRWHSASGEQDSYSRLIERVMRREFPQLATSGRGRTAERSILNRGRWCRQGRPLHRGL